MRVSINHELEPKWLRVVAVVVVVVVSEGALSVCMSTAPSHAAAVTETN